MTKWKYYVSQNGWEYAGEVLITANKVEHEWTSPPDPEIAALWPSIQKEDGDVIIADGVRIQFDEPFEFRGEVLGE